MNDNTTHVTELTVGQFKALIAETVKAQFAASQDVLDRLSAQALAEDAAGLTHPLEELLSEDESSGSGG